MKSKKVKLILLSTFFTIIIFSFYIGIFLYPKYKKINNLTFLESAVSTHRLALVSTRISLMGILSLTLEDQKFIDQKDFYLKTINDSLSKIKFQKNYGEKETNEIATQSEKVYLQMANIYKGLNSKNDIYGKIFQYNPVIDMNTDLQNNDYESIYTKADSSINYFNKIKNEYPENTSINTQIENNLIILQKIRSNAGTDQNRQQMIEEIALYESDINLLKQEILNSLKSTLKSTESVSSLRDLSNLIILEDNILKNLSSQKTILRKLLSR